MIRHILALSRRRLVSAFFYSLDGFAAAWKSEEAIKVEMAMLPILVIVAIHFGESGLARALMISSLILVVIVELLNTAIEKTIDRISFEKNDLSKRVKDMGSAAVLGAIVNVVVIWAFVLV